MKFNWFFFLFLFIGFSCTNTPENSNAQASGEKTESIEPAPAPQEQTGPAVIENAYLPSITISELQNMWNTCNQMDYVFYELPISSSVNDQASAQVHLRHISDTPINQAEKARCTKAIGRIFYKTNGEDLIDAEVYFNQSCAFYLFYKKGKATYSNKMTPAGVEHFQQIIAAANGAKIGQ